jgi:hypothetical protein
MPFPVAQVRNRLSRFDFAALFVEELGWNRSPDRVEHVFAVGQQSFRRRAIAELGGVVVIEITAGDGRVPLAAVRKAIHKQLGTLHHEHLLIFLGRDRHESLWSWQKREAGKAIPREHLFVREQPADLFLTKLADLVFEVTDFGPNGLVSVTEVSSRLRNALDVQTVTRQFFREFQEQHESFVDLIQGIADARERHWYASVLLHRLMFVWFLQKKGFVDGGNYDYLPHKLAASKVAGKNQFFRAFLGDLFFQGFALPEEKRTPEVRQRIGRIRYLNGGLFLPHVIETRHGYGPGPGDVSGLGEVLQVPDVAFDRLFGLFESYTWALDDTPGGDARGVNPDVLGYIFEKYINQKAFGAYYTKPEITEYLCERTIHQLILDAVNDPADAVLPPGVHRRHFDTVADLLLGLDAKLCRKLLLKEAGGVLPGLSLLDPACGSGAFLVAAMKTLVNIYSAVLGRIDFLGDKPLTDWKAGIVRQHKSVHYFIKKAIITDNLYGVDLMEEATEIAKLRLFLSLVASAETEDQLEPLPNIDFNVLAGNSLVGRLRVDDKEFAKKRPQIGLFDSSFGATLSDKNRKLDAYRHTTETLGGDLTGLRDTLARTRRETYDTLDAMLLDHMQSLGVMYEEATWDAKAGKEGRAKKRALKLADVQGQHPFHWGYDFDQVMNEKGGFDAILTNPPWEVWKPNSREFLMQYATDVTVNLMPRAEFDARQGALLAENDKVRREWLDYVSRYAFTSSYFRATPQFANQTTIADGRRVASDINLYKLFTEQCVHLLRPGGTCGIVIPSGIYSDKGAQQLREMLFGETTVTGLFGFENRQEVFEGVDSRFKFVVLTFRKGGTTVEFPAAFMRHDLAELAAFPRYGAVPMSVALARKLAPDSLALMEFRSARDVDIAEKMLRWPSLRAALPGAWKAVLATEFHMTNDRRLFKDTPGPRRLPLYGGRMIHQFDAYFAEPRAWVDIAEGRAAALGRLPDNGQLIEYQSVRLGFRDIASNTNERTLISAVLPSAFCGNKVPYVRTRDDGGRQLMAATDVLFLCAIWNSFACDWFIRLKVNTTLNFFFMYDLPIPRLAASDPRFAPIVHRAALLTCTTPAFDDLARTVGLHDHRDGATDPDDRARLRAEIDGLVAHLYGLTEEEFAHVLATFPLVPAPVTLAAANAWRDVAQGRLP